MHLPSAFLSTSPYHLQAQEALLQKNYGLAANLYEQAIGLEPEVRSYYWHLGLVLLLQGQEEEAQTTWLMAMAEGEPDEIDQWTEELLQVLQTEADRQTRLEDYPLAWGIRRHIREIAPLQLENLLSLVGLSQQMGQLSAEEVVELGVVPALRACAVGHLNPEALLQSLGAVLQVDPDPIIVEFAAATLPHIPNLVDFGRVLLPAVMRFAHTRRVPKLSADLVEVYLQRDPDHVEMLGHLSTFYQSNREYDRGIEVARRRLALSPNLAEQVFSSHILLRGLMSAGGYWQESLATMKTHKQLLAQLFQEQPQDLHSVHTVRLFSTGSFQPYFADDLAGNRQVQNQLAQVCQNNIRTYAAATIDRYQHAIAARNHTAREKAARDKAARGKKVLKIGYLSHCMAKHSVGWLARWLVQHHDRSQFQLHGYFYGDRQNDAMFNWYREQMDKSACLGVTGPVNAMALADQICEDEIDILVDLDSITIDIGCELLTVKPAPIQITWLGWDASGLDAIDYFLADPYVLPDHAQEHYVEKLWRLPHTYLAVDGFEVGVPTLRRDRLNIPNDAVVYLSAQTGYKRHPDTIRLQMQIIQHVPNSYFLIKGLGDQAAIQNVFIEIAEEVGVDADRLRFLPIVDSEAVHRANLGIADVVLDTFPYNGATTTMETLWMGIPLVTRVGQQFASRNSYTMLKNVGIEEGIAWTDAEYVEWGVRLGKDSALREDVAWRLQRSRQTAPLWNAAAFTRDVEHAYQQMWQIYQDGL